MTHQMDITQYVLCIAQGADDINVAIILGNQVLPHQIQVVQWSEFAQSGHWLRYGAIVSCVISAEYDAMDLCKLLAQEHYTGNVIFLTGLLPRPAMVLRELRSQFPNLNLELRQDMSYITSYEVRVARGQARQI